MLPHRALIHINSFKLQRCIYYQNKNETSYLKIKQQWQQQLSNRRNRMEGETYQISLRFLENKAFSGILNTAEYTPDEERFVAVTQMSGECHQFLNDLQSLRESERRESFGSTSFHPPPPPNNPFLFLFPLLPSC